MCSHIKDWKCASVHMFQTYEAVMHIVKNIYFYNILTKVNTSNISPYNDGNFTYKEVISQVKKKV